MFSVGLLSASLLTAAVPSREIRLQGSFNFDEVVQTSEEQLGLSIELPSKMSSRSSREYNQIITLRQLCDAIVHQYAQDDIPVTFVYKDNILKFTRSDIPKSIKKRTYPPKPSTTKKKVPKPSKVPTFSQPPEREDNPTLPSWAVREPELTPRTEATIPTLSRSGVQRSAPTSPPSPAQNYSNQGIDDLEDPFEFSIPSRTVFKPEAVEPKPQRTPVVPAPPATPAPKQHRYTPPTSSYPASKAYSPPGPAKFGITPYPEDAVAFINDAPSIVPGAARENYIEWQTRMQGALENQNTNVLKNERLELERRLRWLDQQLP